MSYRRWATLAVIPVMVIAGCSGKADTPAPGAAGGSTGGSTGGSSWSAGQPTVKVGLISAMTGPFAVLGISQQNGMQVAVDRINAAGGVGGAKLEIVTRDMQLDPGKAVGFANELAGDPSVSFVVGPSITAFYNAAKGTFESNKKLNCQPAVAGGTFADTTYGFRMENSATQDVTRNLEYLQSKGLTKVGLVYEGDDTGKDYAKLMTDLGPKYGVTLVGFEQSRADDASHVAYVQSLMDKGAQAIWISNSGSGAKTMAAAEQAKFDGLMIGGSGAQNISFLEADLRDGSREGVRDERRPEDRGEVTQGRRRRRRLRRRFRGRSQPGEVARRDGARHRLRQPRHPGRRDGVRLPDQAGPGPRVLPARLHPPLQVGEGRPGLVHHRHHGDQVVR